MQVQLEMYHNSWKRSPLTSSQFRHNRSVREMKVKWILALLIQITNLYEYYDSEAHTNRRECQREFLSTIRRGGVLLKSHGKVGVRLGLAKFFMHLTKCLVDRGPSSDACVKQRWRKRIQQKLTPKFQAGTKQAIPVDGVVPVMVEMEDLQVRTCFGIVKNWAVDAFLRKMFIDRGKPGISTLKGKLGPFTHGQQQHLGNTLLARKYKNIVGNTAKEKRSYSRFHPISRAHSNIGWNEAKVKVTTSGSGLMTIWRPKNHKTSTDSCPLSIEEAQPHRPFLLLVNSFSRKPVIPNKQRIIAVETEPPSAVVTLSIDDKKKAQIKKETHKSGWREYELMMIKDLKESREARMDCRKQF